MTKVQYGISVLSSTGAELQGVNPEIKFETMSGIKSLIGTLAIEKAARSGHDLDTFTLHVQQDHFSNGATTLRERLVALQSGFSLDLRTLLQLNIAHSDCIATNALIDYMDGKETINSETVRRLGLTGIELLSNQLQFPGVDHDAQPFQVGVASMSSMSRYYQTIWSPDTAAPLTSPEHQWHKEIHATVKEALLLGVRQAELPPHLMWHHKTGSGEDVRPGYLYSTLLDGGELTTANGPLYIASAMTVRHDGTDMPSRDTIRTAYAAANRAAIAEATRA